MRNPSVNQSHFYLLSVFRYIVSWPVKATKGLCMCVYLPLIWDGCENSHSFKDNALSLMCPHPHTHTLIHREICMRATRETPSKPLPPPNSPTRPDPTTPSAPTPETLPYSNQPYSSSPPAVRSTPFLQMLLTPQGAYRFRLHTHTHTHFNFTCVLLIFSAFLKAVQHEIMCRKVEAFIQKNVEPQLNVCRNSKPAFSSSFMAKRWHCFNTECVEKATQILPLSNLP